MLQIDEIDTKILHALINDARSKLKDIAEDCKISTTAVKKRIENLEKNKVIIKPAVSINMEYFGYPHMVLIGVNVDHDQEQNVIELVRKHTKVAGIDQTIGNYDLCLFVFAESVKELDKLKHVIRKQKGITNVEINIWHKSHNNYGNLNI